MWISGKIPAHITAKIVMASAERLTDVRHFCRNRNRTAEISVPAWPMPTQNTKFVMSNAQPTVGSGPRCRCRWRSGTRPLTSPGRAARPRRRTPPTTAPRAGLQRRADVVGDVASVLSPGDQRGLGAMRISHGAASFVRGPSAVTDHSQVADTDGLTFELLENAVAARAARGGDAARLFGSFRSPNTMACAGQDCWQAVRIAAVGERPPRALRLGLRLVDALDAERALLHDPARADGDVGVQGQVQQRVVSAG